MGRDERGGEAAGDREAFERCQRYVRERCPDEARGLYGPGSITWEVMREPCVLLAAPSAVLLQLAHPAICDGVSRYSSFAKDYAGRARRTFTTMYDLVFGSLPTALAASHGLFRMHARIRGVVDEPGSPWHGRAYRANDQELLRWVAVTLPVCVNQVFHRAVRRLGRGDRERLYEEQIVGAAAVGVLPETMPATREAFDAWYPLATSPEHLHVGDKARALFAALQAGRRSLVLRTLSAAFLPVHVREGYGLPFGRREEAVLGALLGGISVGNQAVPRTLRSVLAFHQATRRVARERGVRPPLASWLADTLTQIAPVPTALSGPRGAHV